MTAQNQSRYREIEAVGPPRELGRQIGEQAREETRGFCEVALERVNKTVDISRQRAIDIARQSTEFAEKYRPDLVDELRGTAEAAGVTLDDLMLLQVRNQFAPEKEGGCTSLSIQQPDNECIVAQTWDNDPALDEFTVVLTRRPEGKPATIACTQAGLISYMGFSETGMGACVNTLPAPSRGIGVPHYFTLRELFEATSLDEAVNSVRRAHRAIPVNVMLATPQGPANLEITIDDVRTLRPQNANWLAHSNHCVHPELVCVNEDFPDLIQSQARKQRIDKLMMSTDGTLEELKRILSDHDGHPKSICRHPNDDQDNGFWTTVFAMIIEPSVRRMHISRGTPCQNEFDTYVLS
ncbi:MAG: isopenicillin-N N-acyltransferase-like protein [Pirellulaceae bacterium]|jgi:isopenicillin-N N-acyltransferase-like protein